MEDKDAIIFELRKEIEELKKIIVELRKENADLKEQLRLNSQNSSKPPSSIPLKKIRKVQIKYVLKDKGLQEDGFHKKKSVKPFNIFQKNVMVVEEVNFFQKQKWQ